MQKVKYIYLMLVLNIFNFIIPMEKPITNVADHKDIKVCLICNLPTEILLNIFKKLLKVGNIKNIYQFYENCNIDRLKPLSLCCRFFNSTIQIYLIEIRKLKDEFIKDYKLLSKQELDEELFNVLKHAEFDLNFAEKGAKLIMCGANPNIRGSFNRTILLGSADYGYTDIVRLLLKSINKVDLNLKDCGHNTALILASCKGHVKIVRLLLECKNSKDPLDLNNKNIFGNTALMLANHEGHSEIVKLLEEYLSQTNTYFNCVLC